MGELFTSSDNIKQIAGGSIHLCLYESTSAFCKLQSQFILPQRTVNGAFNFPYPFDADYHSQVSCGAVFFAAISRAPLIIFAYGAPQQMD